MSEFDFLFKIIIVGDGLVGKTAILTRFIENRFEEHYAMTRGVDFATKIINTKGYKVNLQVWDTGGQEIFSHIRPLFYKGAAASINVFDLANRESFENLPKWIEEVKKKCGDIPFILVGNKSDLSNRAMENKEINDFSKKMGMNYLETSAKTGSNVYDLFTKLSEMLLNSEIIILKRKSRD